MFFIYITNQNELSIRLDEEKWKSILIFSLSKLCRNEDFFEKEKKTSPDQDEKQSYSNSSQPSQSQSHFLPFGVIFFNTKKDNTLGFGIALQTKTKLEKPSGIGGLLKLKDVEESSYPLIKCMSFSDGHTNITDEKFKGIWYVKFSSFVQELAKLQFNIGGEIIIKMPDYSPNLAEFGSQSTTMVISSLNVFSTLPCIKHVEKDKQVGVDFGVLYWPNLLLWPELSDMQDFRVTIIKKEAKLAQEKLCKGVNKTKCKNVQISFASCEIGSIQTTISFQSLEDKIEKGAWTLLTCSAYSDRPIGEIRMVVSLPKLLYALQFYTDTVKATKEFDDYILAFSIKKKSTNIIDIAFKWSERLTTLSRVPIF